MIPWSALDLPIQRSLGVPVENSPAVSVQFMYIYLHAFWTTFGYAEAQLLLETRVPDHFLKVQQSWGGGRETQLLRCNWHPAYNYSKVNDRSFWVSLLLLKRPVGSKRSHFFPVGYHGIGKDRAFRQGSQNDQVKGENFSPLVQLTLFKPEQHVLARSLSPKVCMERLLSDQFHVCSVQDSFHSFSLWGKIHLLRTCERHVALNGVWVDFKYFMY